MSAGLLTPDKNKDRTPSTSDASGESWVSHGNNVTQIGFTGGFLIPLPSWEAKGYDTIMFRGPATSLRLPLTHSELSLETILNKVSAV